MNKLPEVIRQYLQSSERRQVFEDIFILKWDVYTLNVKTKSLLEHVTIESPGTERFSINIVDFKQRYRAIQIQVLSVVECLT